MFDFLLDIDLWLETLGGSLDLAAWIDGLVEQYEAAGQAELWNALPLGGKIAMAAILALKAIDRWKDRADRVGRALFR